MTAEIDVPGELDGIQDIVTIPPGYIETSGQARAFVIEVRSRNWADIRPRMRALQNAYARMEIADVVYSLAQETDSKRTPEQRRLAIELIIGARNEFVRSGYNHLDRPQDRFADSITEAIAQREASNIVYFPTKSS